MTHDTLDNFYDGHVRIKSTLVMIFSVTYYLKLSNAKNIYCTTHFLTNKGQISCLKTIKNEHLYLVNNYINH